jgi:hypothetical protein
MVAVVAVRHAALLLPSQEGLAPRKLVAARGHVAEQVRAAEGLMKNEGTDDDTTKRW